VIREAERCQTTPERAYRFGENGGLERLNRAIAAAKADGHDEWVDRGRAARQALAQTVTSHGTTIPDDE